MYPKVYAAIPVLNEFENIPYLVSDLMKQEGIDWQAIICVNQPEEWWNNTEKEPICQDNRQSIEFLESLNSPQIHTIDKSGPGKGWIGKKHGVGWARKTAMDTASSLAGPDDLIISMDADTRYDKNFFVSVADSSEKYPEATGISVPYYHPLTGNETADRCILRYEIYMRNYALNMLLIDHPYAFSAIGSGMACKASVYRQNGGLTPKLSGEDFYFIQKLRKQGPIIVHCETSIYPEARFSDRVYFGTGPAMIKGRAGNWDSYPIYHQRAFQHVKETFNAFDQLYTSEVQTPMDEMLTAAHKGRPVWQPLRDNAASLQSFVKACLQKVDALKVLQFLKESNDRYPDSNEERLASFLITKLNPDESLMPILQKLSFIKTGIHELNQIRDFMVKHELMLQKIKGTV